MNYPLLKLYHETLRCSGASNTRARKLVFHSLAGQKPQSINQINKKLTGKIDRASLYRTIELFESIGIVRKVHIGWKYKLELTEKFSSHHHHIHCLSCGKMIDIKEPPQLETYIKVIAQKTGFSITSHAFELEGMCQKCQDQAA